MKTVYEVGAPSRPFPTHRHTPRRQYNPVVAGVALGSARLHQVGKVYSVLRRTGQSQITHDALVAAPLLIADPGINIDELSISVTTAAASSQVRIGIYGDNGGVPGTLLVEAGTLATTTIGVKTLTGLDIDLIPGLWWVATVSQTSGASIPFLANSSAEGIPIWGTDSYSQLFNNQYFPRHVSVSGALPGTFTPDSTWETVSAAVAYKVAAIL